MIKMGEINLFIESGRKKIKKSKRIQMLGWLSSIPHGSGVSLMKTPAGWLIYAEAAPTYCYYIEDINDIME